MDNKGFIQLPRTVLNDQLWSNPVDFRIYTYIYLNACFKEYSIGSVNLRKGQLLKSRRKMQEDLSYIENRQVKKYSLSTIQRSIKRLVELKLIEEVGTELGTVLTVINYSNNGENEKDYSKLGTELETTAKQLRNNNNNVLIMSNKEEEEKKEIPFNFFDEFIKTYGRQPSPLQIEKICSFLDEGISQELLIYGFKKSGIVTTNFRYFETMLNDWVKRGLKTISDVEKKDLRKEIATNERSQIDTWQNKFGF